ncbi:cobaltochelatase subunit CobN, partial [Methylogaea oryzae]|uniref:cobaltochelatase subunit CobN n=1 Tax=Methylogaea oryzae TaxID=1295382 RepID=UPI00156A97EE
MRDAGVIVLRLLGKLGAVPGLTELVKAAVGQGRSVLALSGAGDMNPELAGISSVPAGLLHETLAYFQHGGVPNLAQGLRFLADHLLLTGYGYEPPQAMPEHGIYHPELPNGAGLQEWHDYYGQRPAIGILFYRAHWLSGNTAFVDALVEALEEQGYAALPVYTASLRSLDESGRPLALEFFRDFSGSLSLRERARVRGENVGAAAPFNPLNPLTP